MLSAVASIAEAGRGLSSDELSIDGALDVVLDVTGADRVSLSAIDERAATFELLAARGGWLLAPGTRFPTSVSTHFQLAAENGTFVGDQLEQDPLFDRPVDQLVLAHGFGAGVCLPVRHERGAPGALAIHFRRAGGQARAAVPLVEPLLGALSVALARVRRTPQLGILVCHSDALVARGLAHLLGERPGAQVRICGTVARATEIAVAVAPDVIVADNALEGVRVDRWCGPLLAALPSALVIVASHDTPENRTCALAAGALAYIPRGSVAETLLGSLDAIASGTPPVAWPVASAPSPALTARELEVLRQLDLGLRLREIAVALDISHATVKAHLRNLFRKLGAGSRAEATHAARLQGLLDR
jgi:two-component system nitrate/nitrite response regulator NarL